MTTIPQTRPDTDLSTKPLVLATDLDGTFLGGPEPARRSLYSWIERNRHAVGLVFVTGRDPGHVRSLTRSRGIPRPDFVVGDVGTTIASVDRDHMLTPIPELEAEIAGAWNNATMRVQSALHRMPGLRLQSTGFRYRVSYDMDPERFDDRALDVVAALGLDALASDNRFLDVLPRGVSKGPSLLRLLSHLGVENHRCLVAGDTLNDLSMLSLGLPAVAVGNSEPALIGKLRGAEHVHFATGEGAAGIAEAILALDIFGRNAA